MIDLLSACVKSDLFVIGYMFEFKSLTLKVLSCVPPLIHDSRSPCSLKVRARRLSSSVSFRNLRLILAIGP